MAPFLCTKEQKALSRVDMLCSVPCVLWYTERALCVQQSSNTATHMSADVVQAGNKLICNAGTANKCRRGTGGSPAEW